MHERREYHERSNDGDKRFDRRRVYRRDGVHPAVWLYEHSVSRLRNVKPPSRIPPNIRRGHRARRLLANLFFSPIVAYDLVFGVGQSVLALLITIVSMRYVENIWARMAINTLSFTVTMAIIAFELKLALGFPFWLTWLTTAIGEFVVMAIGAPIMYAVGRRIAPEAFRAADGRND